MNFGLSRFYEKYGKIFLQINSFKIGASLSLQFPGKKKL